MKHGGNINIEQIRNNRSVTVASTTTKQTTDSNNVPSMSQAINATSATSALEHQLNSTASPMNQSLQSAPPLLAPLLRAATSNPQNHSKEMQAVQERFNSLINSISSGVVGVTPAINHHASEMDQTTRTTSGKKQYDCVHCSYTTDNKSQFSYHKSLHKPIAGEELKCNYCSYTTTKKMLLTQHLRIHQSVPNDVIVVESETNAVFPNGSGEANAGDSPGKPSPSENNKENRLLSGTKRKRTEVMCPYCPFVDYSAEVVNEHKQFHLAVSNERLKFTCEFCDFNAHNERAMKDHRKLHFSFLEKGNSATAVEYCTTFDKLKLFVAAGTATAGGSLASGKDKKIYDEEEIEDENPWMANASSSSGTNPSDRQRDKGLNGKGRTGKMATEAGTKAVAAINV